MRELIILYKRCISLRNLALEPFLELQAIARAQRIGQTKQVVAIRYVIVGTTEQVTGASSSLYSSKPYMLPE
jgi:hypothetical protein